MNQQDSPDPKPDSLDAIPATSYAEVAARDPLAKAFDRLQADFHRLENRCMRLETQFHDFAVRYVVSNGDRLQIAIDTAKRIEAVEARLAARTS